jgi:hypothetical protein
MTTVPGKPNKFRKMPANSIKIKTVNPATAKKDNLFLPLHLGKLQIFKEQHDRAGNEYGRIRAKHDADQQ